MHILLETAGIHLNVLLRLYLCHAWRYYFEILNIDISVVLLSDSGNKLNPIS